MPYLKKADLVRRLGFPLESLEFRGQCHDLGPGMSQVCKATHRPTRHCFTLKRIDGGSGKAVVGLASFQHFKRHAPLIYLQLERGRLYLELYTDAEARALHQASQTKQLQRVQKKLSQLRVEARQRIYAWRAENRRGPLPETLANLKAIVATKAPKHEDHNAAMLWFENEIAALEAQLMSPDAVALEREVNTPLPVAPAAKPTPKAATRKFTAIPEIEF